LKELIPRLILRMETAWNRTEPYTVVVLENKDIENSNWRKNHWEIAVCYIYQKKDSENNFLIFSQIYY
jgi:hypothetical protein